jgi:alpha-2-macroglobulin-like protein
MKRLNLLLISILFSLNIFSQNYFTDLLKNKLDIYQRILPYEKIYLQCDRPLYKPGDDIWTAIWIVDGVTNKASSISDIVYVELLDQQGNITEAHRVIASKGRAMCDFNIDSASTGGSYKIRAYTNWMKNFELSSYFEKNIQVQNSELPRILMKLDFERKAYGAGDSVVAYITFNSLNNQPLSNYEFIYTANINGSPFFQKSSLTDNTGKATARLVLPQELKSIDGTLNVSLTYKGNTESVTRYIPIVLNQIDLQFLPEGGDLITETENNCAFKAINEFGKPADITGTVFNSKHQLITTFKSYHQGMGAFKFIPKKGEKYYALIDRPEGILQLYPLPTVIDSGFMMTIPHPLDFINPLKNNTGKIKIYSSKISMVGIMGQTNGKVYFNKNMLLQKGDNFIEIPLEAFPSGVAKFTLFTNNNIETCERLVFIKKDQKLKIELSTDKNNYAPREKVTLKIKTTSQDGKPVSSSLGIAVVDNKLLSLADDKSDNILSYLLLSSELTGKIEEPKFYFDSTETKADSALDYLLLTQGWRRFTWKEIAEKNNTELKNQIKNYPEKRILFGTIHADKKGLTSVKLQIKETGETIIPNKDGYYEFKDLDLTSPLTLWVIKNKKDTITRIIKDYSSASDIKESNLSLFNTKKYNTAGIVTDEKGNPIPGCNVYVKGTNYGTITDIDGKYFLNTVKNDILAFRCLGYNTLENNMSLKKGNKIVLSNENKELEELCIEGYGLKRRHNLLTGTIVNSKKINIEINQDNTLKKTNKIKNEPLKFKSDNSVIKFIPPKGDEINLNSTEVTENNEIDNESLVYCFVEQMPEYPGGYDKLREYLSQTIRYPQEALENEIQGRVFISFIVNENGSISDARVVRGTYPILDNEALKVINNMPRWRPCRQNGKPVKVSMTLPVYFRLNDNGHGYYETDDNPNETSLTYYKTREFYSPQYTNDDEITERTDFRKTIYWNPQVSTDSSGQTEVSFYTGDELTSYKVTSEGIGKAGNIGRCEHSFYTSKPLAIDVKMPQNASVGDTLLIPITLSNLTNSLLSGKLTVKFSKSVKLANNIPDSIFIKAQSSVTLYAEGAVVNDSADYNCYFKIDAGKYRDAISKFISNSIEGFPVKYTCSGNKQHNNFNIKIPDYIPNTLNAKITVYPNLLTTLSSTFESMLQEPNGCFEQTSATTYPNILILKYLKNTKQLDTETESRALNFIKIGYKKLAQYECSHSGFEWFGKSPAHEGLTAFGLMEFNDMQQVFPLEDKNLIKRTTEWLLSRRDNSGGFLILKGKYGFSKSSFQLNNAYIIYALSEVGCINIFNEFNVAFEDNIKQGDTYRLALLANTALNLKDTIKAEQIISTLKKSIEKNHLGNLPAETSITGSSGKSLQVETASLIALALLKQKQIDSTLLYQCKSFILNSKAFNSFGSTQANILALKVLSFLAKEDTLGKGSVSFSLNNQKNANHNFSIGQNDPLTIYGLEKYLNIGNNSLDVDYNSNLNPFFNVDITFKQKEPAYNYYPLHLETKYLQNSIYTGQTVRLNISLFNQDNYIHSMTVAVIKIPAGLTVETWQLKELQDKMIYDFYELKDNQLILYFTNLNANEKRNINLDLKAIYPGTYQPLASYCYFYYNAEKKSWSSGERIKINIPQL